VPVNHHVLRLEVAVRDRLAVAVLHSPRDLDLESEHPPGFVRSDELRTMCRGWGIGGGGGGGGRGMGSSWVARGGNRNSAATGGV
jgi:hypothetical protein